MEQSIEPRKVLLRTAVLVLGTAALAAAAGRNAFFLRADVGDGCVTERLAPGSDSIATSTVLGFKVVDFACGSRVNRHFCWAAGASLGYFRPVGEVAILPLHGWLLWDLSPDQTWRKGFAYTRLSLFLLDAQTSADGSGGFGSPRVSLDAGVSYTFYAVTPYAEIGYSTGWQSLTLSAGVALGGNHIFARR